VVLTLDGPEHNTLQSEAGYIDARPKAARSMKPLATHGRTIHWGHMQTTPFGLIPKALSAGITNACRLKSNSVSAPSHTAQCLCDLTISTITATIISTIKSVITSAIISPKSICAHSPQAEVRRKYCLGAGGMVRSLPPPEMFA
jgi:hypothetical protein